MCKTVKTHQEHLSHAGGILQAIGMRWLKKSPLTSARGVSLNMMLDQRKIP